MATPLLSAQSITVDLALDDFMDFSGGQTVADLPGPDGHITIREAITAANNTPGPQTIAFAIPRSEWSIFYDDRALIRLENMLYVSDPDTTVDFSTQTAFTGDTNPDGNEVGLQYAGVPAAIPSLWLAADRGLVRGLDVTIGNNFGNGVWITANDCRVLGCTTGGLTIRGDYGGGAFNVIGGTAPGEGNTFSEDVVVVSDADDNVVVGNFFGWGLRISGDTYWGTCDRNRVGGPTVRERNVLSGRGYYGEEGYPDGTQLNVSHAVNTLIEGNYVGTTRNGMAKYPGSSGTGGITVGLGAVDTVLRNNLVSGIVMIGADHYQGQRFGIGIAVVASATRTTLAGNWIGVAADGVSPIPNVEGILVQSDPNGTPLNVRIGGTTAESNLVAFSETTGIVVAGASSGVAARVNSIHDNGALGIDLVGTGGLGVTLNDLRDLDNGANRLQNYPVLRSAMAWGVVGGGGAQVRVTGSLNSTPNQPFALDLYANAAADPSGHGEGEVFLGTTVVRTDAAGDARFAVVLPLPAGAGSVISATATDAAGNTSEFSAGVTLSGPAFTPAR
ncbi:MAG: hypothetical protein EYC70_01395 [Planctomycetota bacterium]|nr:MAG: hypothetical protein EYC70_01395 [Planctomycetota bacterium]